MAAGAQQPEIDFYYAVEMALIKGSLEGHTAMVDLVRDIHARSNVRVPPRVLGEFPGKPITELILDHALFSLHDEEVKRAIRDNKAVLSFKGATFAMRLYPAEERWRHRGRWLRALGGIAAIPASVPSAYRDLWWADHMRVEQKMLDCPPIDPEECDFEWVTPGSAEAPDEDDIQAFVSLTGMSEKWLRAERRPQPSSVSPEGGRVAETPRARWPPGRPAKRPMATAGSTRGRHADEPGGLALLRA